MLAGVLVVYAVGVVIGLLRVDANVITRITVAALWPIGVVAGVITVTALLLVAMVLFPIFGGAVLLAVGSWWWVAGG